MLYYIYEPSLSQKKYVLKKHIFPHQLEVLLLIYTVPEKCTKLFNNDQILCKESHPHWLLDTSHYYFSIV